MENLQKKVIFLNRQELIELLDYESTQLTEEGYNLSDEKRRLLQSLKESGGLEDAYQCYETLQKAEPISNYPYIEPSDIVEIRKELPDVGSHLKKVTDEHDLHHRLQGAWFGRCVGCLMGKPVEGWPRKAIEAYLKATKSYPLQDYFHYSPADLPDPKYNFHHSAEKSTKGNIDSMPRDDDLDFPVLNLRVLEKHGFQFSTENVAAEWLLNLPYNMIYTAEKRAYANLIIGLTAPHTATHWNPFREWIGAQIRADVFGYTAPGNPALAASLAYRDARLSHTKNGIYGSMFVAAAVSAAFAAHDIEEIIRSGLSQIPVNSRLSTMVRQILAWRKEVNMWEDAWKKVEEQFGQYHWVHTIPNLAYVLIGLLWGGLDFESTVGIAVMSGRDTDCNGATAGSILGALGGISKIPIDMLRPLNDKLKTLAFDCSCIKISELAERTLQLIKNRGGL